MMTTQDMASAIDQARSALSLFMRAMHDWEERNYAIINDALNKGQGAVQEMTQATEAVRAIFDAHCVPGKADRRRQEGLSIGWPTTYDIDRDTLDEGHMVKQAVIFLYQQNDGAKDLIRFTMKNHKGNWLVYKAECFDIVKDKWRGYIL